MAAIEICGTNVTKLVREDKALMEIYRVHRQMRGTKWA
jgi:hypothetical protein